MNVTPKSFAAVVLAGGQSRRMGTDKAHLPHPTIGLPLLLHQLDLVASTSPRARLVSAREDQSLPPLPTGVERVDDDGTAGPMAGIMAALSVTRQSHLLVVAVDLPHLTSDVLRTLIGACSADDRGAYAQTTHGPEPLVSFVPTTALPELEAALARGERSPHRLFTGALSGTMSPVLFTDPNPFLNWNTPTDI